MLLTNTFGEALGFADAGIISLLGYCVVFLGLVLLMIVVTLIGKCASLAKEKPAPAPKEEAPAEEIPQPEAPGAAGHLKLHTVDPKTAAMLMAIVAEKTGKPLNELRFISIKEVS